MDLYLNSLHCLHVPTFFYVVSRKEYLEAAGFAGTFKHRISILADKFNGVYDLQEHKGLHREAPKEGKQRALRSHCGISN